MSTPSARDGCPYMAHTTQGHGYCCHACRGGCDHGPHCERMHIPHTDEIRMAPETEPEPAKDETSEEPGAEPNLVLVEDANGETFVIPEELLASLSQCAIDAAAAEVAKEKGVAPACDEEMESAYGDMESEKMEPTTEKESTVSADSWEKAETEQEPSEADWAKAEEQFPCGEDEVKASVLATQISVAGKPVDDFLEEPGNKQSEFGFIMEQYGIHEVYSLGTPKLGEDVDRKELQALVLLANDGKEDWPAGTSLRCVAGHDLGVQSMELECKAGEVAEVVLHFDVNQGHVGPSYWAMVAPTGQPFGVLLTLNLP